MALDFYNVGTPIKHVNEKSVFLICPSAFASKIFLSPLIEYLLSKQSMITIVFNGKIEEGFIVSKNLKYIGIDCGRSLVGRFLFGIRCTIIIFKYANLRSTIFTLGPINNWCIASACCFKKLNLYPFLTGQLWVNGGPCSPIFKIFDYLVIKNSQMCFVDSQSQVDLLRLTYGEVAENKIVLIANGSICGVEKSYNFEKTQSSFTVGLYGRFCLQKGVVDFQHLVKWASEFAPHWNFKIGGPVEGGVAKRILDDLLLNYPAVKYVGTVSEYSIFFSDVDIQVCLSSREGFGMHVLEAASCGVPSVGYNVPGLSESISKLNGLLVERSDVESLCQLIIELELDYRRRKMLGADARYIAGRRFSRRQVIKFFENIFDESFL